ncbi:MULTISPECIES: uracil-DNA glycosylase family protein [Diaphorobacter]|uniref:Uracil-DNA glycosylase n=1 Tax=Diaphorobacter nitroreducens TaxID=164759 RepID=A0AAX1WQT3_9BURK|nr:uracil-DNA glycosylase [Diaphorobacter nitroreducens]
MPMKIRTPSLRKQTGASIPTIRLNSSTKDSLEALLREVRACKICSASLPMDPRPVLQCHGSARILIVGQAPGRKVHESGIPFQDASGERLRSWLGVTSEIFYDERRVAILPMGFCFPGTGVSGDLPPRPECAPAWRNKLLKHLKSVQLTLVIGQFAHDYHLPNAGSTVTEVVQSWRMHLPSVIPLPHPSPRNNRWLARNPWFEAELLPVLRKRVALSLSDA